MSTKQTASLRLFLCEALWPPGLQDSAELSQAEFSSSTRLRTAASSQYTKGFKQWPSLEQGDTADGGLFGIGFAHVSVPDCV